MKRRRFPVFRKSRHHRADHGKAGTACFRGGGINIGKQTVTQRNDLTKGVVFRTGLCTESPGLPGGIRSVGAEDRQHAAELKPADVQLPVARILNAAGIVSPPEPRFTAVYKETADIQRPPGQAAAGGLDAFGHLLLQHVPAGTDISGPKNGAEGAAVCSAAAGKKYRAPVRQIPEPVIPEAAQMFGSVTVHHLGIHAHFGGFHNQAHPFFRRPFLRTAPIRIRHGFAAVAPESVRAAAHPEAHALLPVKIAGGRGEGVIGLAGREKRVRRLHLVPVPAGGDVRPDGNHQPDVHAVEGGREGGYIRKTFRIRCFIPPASVFPAHPVQNNAVQPQIPAAEFPGGLDKFLRGTVTLFGLDITISPFWQESRSAFR